VACAAAECDRHPQWNAVLPRYVQMALKKIVEMPLPGTTPSISSKNALFYSETRDLNPVCRQGLHNRIPPNFASLDMVNHSAGIQKACHGETALMLAKIKCAKSRL
jgi:hypothetical protein